MMTTATARPTLPRLFLVVGWLLAAAPAAFSAAPKWLKLEGPDFVIYSDAPEKQVVDCALRYAGFRHAFNTLFAEPGRQMPPSTLLLFYRDKPFRALLPAKKEDTFRTVNVSCDVDGQALNVFAIDGDRDEALGRTFEFETMWALRSLGHFVPLWMSQGAGEVLSTLQVNPDKGKMVLGLAESHEFNETYDWPVFFTLGNNSKEYSEADQLGDYLNQAWGLMHWVLLTDGNNPAGFNALEQALRTQNAIPAIQAAMHVPEKELTRTIRRHTGKRREMPFDTAAVKASFHLSPAPGAEVLVQTSEALLASGRDYDASAKLDEAAALAPDLPMVKEARARQRLREDRTRDAVDLYREAIEAGSRNFAAYLRSAALRLDDNSSGGRDVAGEGGAAAATALTEIRRALELNPGSLEAYRLLGRALFVLRNPTAAQVEELAAGAVPGPDGLSVRLYRAMLYSRLGRRDRCVKEFRTLLSEPWMTDDVREKVLEQYAGEMERLDIQKVEKLAEARDYAGAFAVISAGESDSEPAVAEKYPHFRQWLVEKIRHDPDATPEQRKLAGLE